MSGSRALCGLRQCKTHFLIAVLQHFHSAQRLKRLILEASMESQEMVAQSQICKIVEKYKYWKEFQPNMHHFFRMMTGDFRNQLRIPQKFSINFQGNLSGAFHLRGPSGFMWDVELETRFDAVVFRGKGWQCFVKDHSLADGDLLYFSYNDNSTFNVAVLDSTGCEREGSYFVKKHSTDACSNGRCVLQKEDAEDCEEHISASKESTARINKGKGNPSSKAVDSSQLKATRKRQPKAGKSVGASDFIEISIDDSEESDEDWSTNTVSKRCKTKMKKGYLTNDKRESQSQGSAEKEKPCKLGRRYASPIPRFSITMKPSYVYWGFQVGIPKKWLEVHVPDKVIIAQLSVPPSKKKWPVRIGRTKCRKGFGKGWASFVRGNNLEEDDVCVFELSEKVNEKTIGINVTVCRVNLYPTVN